MMMQNEDIGIAGNFDNFVSYVRAAFASDNVKIVLKGSPSEGSFFRSHVFEIAVAGIGTIFKHETVILESG